MSQTEMTGQLKHDIDPELIRFLREKVNTFVKWDVVQFFHHNPHADDTAENIARYIGRDVASIADELNELATKNVLRARTASGKTIFSLVNDQQTRKLVNEFVRACDDRLFRMQAINFMIQRLG
jgi:hypothetical protein